MDTLNKIKEYLTKDMYLNSQFYANQKIDENQLVKIRLNNIPNDCEISSISICPKNPLYAVTIKESHMKCGGILKNVLIIQSFLINYIIISRDIYYKKSCKTKLIISEDYDIYVNTDKNIFPATLYIFSEDYYLGLKLKELYVKKSKFLENIINSLTTKDNEYIKLKTIRINDIISSDAKSHLSFIKQHYKTFNMLKTMNEKDSILDLYLYFKSYKYVNNKDLYILWEFIKDMDLNTKKDIVNKQNKSHISDLIFQCYYSEKFKDSHFSIYTMADYINMLRKEKLKLSLRTKSFEKIIQKHDRLVKLINKKAFDSIDEKQKLKIHRRYKCLIKNLPKDIIPVVFEKELAYLGQRANNCVYSYKDYINSGDLIICYYEKNTNLITIEISEDENKLYKIAQIYDKYNKEVPPQLLDYINKSIENINQKRKIKLSDD